MGVPPQNRSRPSSPRTPDMQTYRALAAASLLAVLACRDDAVTGGATTGTTTTGTATTSTTTDTSRTTTATGPVTIGAVDCKVEGVNADPYTGAKALAANEADHEAAGDYTWSAGSAVTIALGGTSATVSGAGATVSGGTVTFTAAGTYVLAGTLTDGQVVVTAPSGALVKLVLNGAAITSSRGPAILVSSAAKAVVLLADGTTNRVTDAASYPSGATSNAAIFSEADLSIAGAGALVVAGRYADGITSEDGLVIAGGQLTVSAVDDGVRGKDYLVVRGAETKLDVTAGGDGLKS